MTTAFASEAAHIRETGHLSVPDIARAPGANETTVGAWLGDDRSPSGARAGRLAELAAIVERLVRVMRPEYVPVWMRKPIPLLDDDKPLDVIAAGDYRRVSRGLAGLESPRAAEAVGVGSIALAGPPVRRNPAGGESPHPPAGPGPGRWRRGP